MGPTSPLDNLMIVAPILSTEVYDRTYYSGEPIAHRPYHVLHHHGLTS